MNPYETLDQRAFWSPAVAQRHMLDIGDFWRPKFKIQAKNTVVTFGSCFAQHFGQALKARDFAWKATEVAPVGLANTDVKRFNYNVFSARTGNIYTASLLLQWTKWALANGKQNKGPECFWERGGRIYDPFRPNIEPDGFGSVEEMLQSRKICIEAFREAIMTADIFVFTLGLTESWWHREPGAEEDAYEYPMCPGTIAGEFDPARHHFRNQSFRFVETNLKAAIRRMLDAQPKLKFLLTVSPVPLTATNSGNHVLVATMQSKSVLRAAAGAVSESHPAVDYFPSYEIINAPPFRATFFEPNMRNVNHNGVAHVMKNFFTALGLPESAPSAADVMAKKSKVSPGTAAKKANANMVAGKAEDVVCEEELLAAFGDPAQS